MLMKVICGQLDVAWENKEANFAKVEERLKQLQPADQSWLVLPEMFATGFTMNTEVSQEPAGGMTELFLKKIAIKYSLNIVAGLVTSHQDRKPTNDSLGISSSGEILFRYEKIQLFSMGGESEHYSP